MSGVKCQSTCKSTGKRCTNPAIYLIDNDYVCGVHAGGRKNDRFLIKNQNVGRSKVDDETLKAPSTAIQSGTGRFKIFSNFAPCNFVYRDVTWKSSEAAFQAMKFYYEGKTNGEELFRRVKQIVEAEDAFLANKIGNEAASLIRPDWNDSNDSIFSVKERFMFEILLAKFAPGTEASRDLLSTGDRNLEETSQDPFWGKGIDGQGKNKLGEILMLVRTHLEKPLDEQK
jgi:ribA/ribD-fused uncharacterized protein